MQVQQAATGAPSSPEAESMSKVEWLQQVGPLHLQYLLAAESRLLPYGTRAFQVRVNSINEPGNNCLYLRP
jgi:hypothetical protein